MKDREIREVCQSAVADAEYFTDYWRKWAQVPAHAKRERIAQIAVIACIVQGQAKGLSPADVIGAAQLIASEFWTACLVQDHVAAHAHDGLPKLYPYRDDEAKYFPALAFWRHQDQFNDAG